MGLSEHVRIECATRIRVLSSSFFKSLIRTDFDTLPDSLKLVKRATLDIATLAAEFFLEGIEAPREPLVGFGEGLGRANIKESRKVHRGQEQIAEFALCVSSVAFRHRRADFSQLFFRFVEHPRNIGPIEAQTSGVLLDLP